MTREEAIKNLNEHKTEFTCDFGWNTSVIESLDMAIKALEQTRWIPVKWHNITEEEREREGYPKEWLTMFDCPMPEDEQEILVTIQGSKREGRWVEKDICYIEDGYSLDSGYDWIDDILAWMPLPEPYKGESVG